MPNSMEFWKRLDDTRQTLLIGEPEIAAQKLEDIRKNCLTGDQSVDNKRIELLKVISEICGIPISHQPPEPALERPVAPLDDKPVSGTAEDQSNISQMVADINHAESRLARLPFWGTSSESSEIIVDGLSDMPGQQEISQSGQKIAANHTSLAKIYSEAIRNPELTDILGRLIQAREAVKPARCVDMLITFERHLDLIAQHLGIPGLRDRLTLLDGLSFEADLRRDPSQPYTLLGAALSQFRQGDLVRGSNLLRRLAVSGYPERKQAQRLLAGRVRKENTV